MIEKFVNSKEFKGKWKLFKKTICNEIDLLFVNDYDTKIRLYNGLEHLYNREFNKAYHTIRHLLQCCKNDTERDIINKIIHLSYNEDEMSKVKIGDYLKQDNGGGYYLVVSKVGNETVIKKCFDFEFNNCLNSRRTDYFKIVFTDLKTFQFANNNEVKQIQKYLNQNNEGTRFLKNTNKMIELINEILNSNFVETTGDYNQFHFYRLLDDKVAFVVNLKDKGDFLEIIYGVTTIVDIDFFKCYGASDDNIKLRFKSLIINDSDELIVYKEIKRIYDLYKNISKDDLLKLKKERQKAFINKINDKLKTIGFKKKNTIWTKELGEGYQLDFSAYKSQWSDVYIFDVHVQNPNNKVIYLNRINTGDRGMYNWQLLTDEEINVLFNYVIDDVLRPIIISPLEVVKKYKIN